MRRAKPTVKFYLRILAYNHTGLQAFASVNPALAAGSGGRAGGSAFSSARSGSSSGGLSSGAGRGFSSSGSSSSMFGGSMRGSPLGSGVYQRYITFYFLKKYLISPKRESILHHLAKEAASWQHVAPVHMGIISPFCLPW